MSTRTWSSPIPSMMVVASFGAPFDENLGSWTSKNCVTLSMSKLEFVIFLLYIIGRCFWLFGVVVYFFFRELNVSGENFWDAHSRRCQF